MNPTPGLSPLAERGESRGGNGCLCSKVGVHQFAPAGTPIYYPNLLSILAAGDTKQVDAERQTDAPAGDQPRLQAQ